MSYYRNQIKQRVQFQSERNIQLLLGKTKLDTVFFSLFSEEYPAPVVLSFLFYSLNTRDEQIRMKLAQLRFIYEFMAIPRAIAAAFAAMWITNGAFTV